MAQTAFCTADGAAATGERDERCVLTVAVAGLPTDQQQAELTSLSPGLEYAISVTATIPANGVAGPESDALYERRHLC